MVDARALVEEVERRGRALEDLRGLGILRVEEAERILLQPAPVLGPERGRLRAHVLLQRPREGGPRVARAGCS